jgi:competence protein ComEA
VDVNTADAATLATLPGVGPTIAQRIIDGRPYHSLSDLEKVKGLSHTKVQAFQDQVMFGTTKTKSKTTTTAKTSNSGGSSGSSTTRGSSYSSTKTTETTSTSKLAAGEKININTASAEELDRLPGIGKTKSQAIIDYRGQHGDFKSLEDIQNVKGIKGGEFEKIKDHIKLR